MHSDSPSPIKPAKSLDQVVFFFSPQHRYFLRGFGALAPFPEWRAFLKTPVIKNLSKIRKKKEGGGEK